MKPDDLNEKNSFLAMAIQKQRLTLMIKTKVKVQVESKIKIQVKMQVDNIKILRKTQSLAIKLKKYWS